MYVGSYLFLYSKPSFLFFFFDFLYLVFSSLFELVGRVRVDIRMEMETKVVDK